MTEWPLQDAIYKFSALVNAALTGEPQRVTGGGIQRWSMWRLRSTIAFAGWSGPTLQP